jgi:hypothetical protein
MLAVRWNPFDAPWPPPERDITKLMVPTDGCHGFETPAAANRERLRRVAVLRRSPDPRAAVFADRLANCDRGARCLSPACSYCVGRTRIWFYAEIARLFNLRGSTAATNLQLITLVHEDWIRPQSALHDFDPRVLIDRVRHQFFRAGITSATVLGAVHGEFDQKRNYWQPHLHLVVSGMQQAQLNLFRQRHYQRSVHVYHPMVVQSVVNPPRQLSYLLKSYWPLRMRYIDAFGEERSNFQRIMEPYHTQYLTILDQFKLLDFIFLIGVRHYGHTLRRTHRDPNGSSALPR